MKAIELQEGDKVSSLFLYQEEPFILLNTATKALMLTIDDLRIRKRARKGDQVADIEKGDAIIGGISIYEGAIRLRLHDGSIQTVHSNDVYLDNPGASPEKITKQPIVGMFRPWEEKSENMAYREQRKAEEKAKKLTEEQKDTDETEQ